MRFVPLTQASPTDGLASVVVASLEDAGFHPALDCDPRGWMHYYGWPRGSIGLLTVWIPEQELAEASAFLAAVSELEAEPFTVEPSPFWTAFSSPSRRWVYSGWLVGEIFGLSAVLALLGGLYGVTKKRRTEDESY